MNGAIRMRYDRFGVPNAISSLKDGQDTLFLKFEKVASMDVELEKKGKRIAASANYAGDSGRALEYHSVKAGCDEQRAVVSNLPTRLGLEFVKDGMIDAVFDSSQPISKIDYAMRLKGCEGDALPLDLMIKAQGIPAGITKAGAMFGKAGKIGITSTSGSIQSADIGFAVAGNTDKYLSIHLEKVRWYLEWDLDGHTEFKGNPYYVFCDYMADRFSYRLRMDNFGLGFRGADPGVGIGCNAFQVGWKFIAIPMCTISIGFPSSCTNVHVPKVTTAGNLAVSVDAFMTAEVLYGGKWWKIPTRLWLG